MKWREKKGREGSTEQKERKRVRKTRRGGDLRDLEGETEMALHKWQEIIVILQCRKEKKYK